MSYFALAEDVALPDGRVVTAYLSEGRGTNQREGWGSLSLTVATPFACGHDTCSTYAYGFVPVDVDQIHFDRSLRTASVQDVVIEIVDPSYFPDPWTGEDPYAGEDGAWTGEDPYTGGDDPWTGEDPYAGEDGAWTGEDPYTGGNEAWTGEEDRAADLPGEVTGGDAEYPDWTIPAPAAPVTVTVSLALTGTGTVDRGASHQTICGDGERECQSTRVEASRTATGRLTVDGQSGESTLGLLSYGHSIDAAAPTFQYDEY